MPELRLGCPNLTERQQQVMQLLDERVPIKIIAARLEVSETRVNQLVSALKRQFGASSLPDLVARYRATALPAEEHPYIKPACINSHLATDQFTHHQLGRVAEGGLFFSDVQSFHRDAPWIETREPRVVPGVLDGNHAVSRRIVTMVGLAAALAAALVLVVVAAVTLGNVLTGVAEVPLDGSQSGG